MNYFKSRSFNCAVHWVLQDSILERYGVDGSGGILYTEYYRLPDPQLTWGMLGEYLDQHNGFCPMPKDIGIVSHHMEYMGVSGMPGVAEINEATAQLNKALTDSGKANDQAEAIRLRDQLSDTPTGGNVPRFQTPRRQISIVKVSVAA